MYEGVLTSLAPLAAELDTGDCTNAQVRALGIFAVMVGTLQASRAVTDPAISDAILEQGIKNALSLAK